MDSRQRILEHMKRAGEASVAELSRALRLTPVTIRHHLETLQSERLLEAPEARRKTGPGRPEMVYRLSPVADRSMPRNYGELCACLLREFQEQPTGRPLTRILTEVGERIRDVRQGPDGLLYVLTDSRDGKLIRLLPD